MLVFVSTLRVLTQLSYACAYARVCIYLTSWRNGCLNTGRLVLKKILSFCVGEYAECGFDQQRLLHGMFFACGIWYLADVSSDSPSSEQADPVKEQTDPVKGGCRPSS